VVLEVFLLLSEESKLSPSLNIVTIFVTRKSGTFSLMHVEPVTRPSADANVWRASMRVPQRRSFYYSLLIPLQYVASSRYILPPPAEQADDVRSYGAMAVLTIPAIRPVQPRQPKRGCFVRPQRTIERRTSTLSPHQSGNLRKPAPSAHLSECLNN
jgi:hypothetical protein